MNRQLLVLLLTMMAVTTTVQANPTGGVVTSGSASITRSQTSTQIQQSSQKAIINWKSFNIGSKERVSFKQPKGGMALNRISPTQGVSKIFGRLTATGQIILINQAGIFFGKGSYVNVGGIIASTTDMADRNFLGGKYIFDQPSSTQGSIVNRGTIIAKENGLVALVGTGVSNEGTIQANVGSVVLASGNKFTVDLAGNELINFAIDEGASSAGIDKDGKKLQSGVNNSGVVMADGGTIVMSARAAKGVLDNAVNMSGVLQANTVSQQDGAIILSAGNEGDAQVSGTMVAGGEKGGKIKVLGQDIQVASSAVMDVSGKKGGGEILIGGNYQGKGPEYNAESTFIDKGAVIKADAIEQGNGGKIIVWADDTTQSYGNLSARGGVLGGDGGLIETSGKKVLNVEGITVDTRAPLGQTGTWLLDPTNIYIATDQTSATNAGMSGTDTSANTDVAGTFAASGVVQDSLLTVANLQAALGSSNVIVTTTNASGTGLGDITVVDPITWASNSLTLTAARNININAGISMSSGASLILNATSNVTQTGIISGAGNVIQQGAGTATFSQANTYSGTTSITSGTLRITHVGGLGSTSGTTINTGAILEINLSNVALSNTNPITMQTNSTLRTNGNNPQINNPLLLSPTSNFVLNTDSYFYGSFSDLTTLGSIVKSGAGNLSSNAASSYTGSTTATRGRLFPTLSNALGTGQIIIQPSAGLTADIYLQDVSSLTNSSIVLDSSSVGSTAQLEYGSNFSNNISLIGSNNVFTQFSPSSGTMSGIISGTGSLIKSSTSILRLSGANIYNGTTTISGGTLQIGIGGTTGTLGSGNVTNNATLAFNRSDSVTISNIIGGTGAVTQSGTGTTTLTGANTYSGVTTISAGTLSFSSSANLGNAAGTNNISLGNGTLRYTGSGTTTSRSITLTAGSGTINVAGTGLLTLSGAINGARPLILSGSSPLAITSDIGGVTPLTTVTANLTSSLSLHNVHTTGAQSYTATGGISTNSSYIANTGDITFASPLTLVDPTTMQATTGNINLDQVDGAFSLGLTAGSGINLQNLIGNTIPLTSISTSSNNLVLSPGVIITASGAGNAIEFVTSTFTNNAGSSALNPMVGRFLVWSSDPSNDNRGGLSYNFKQYDVSYGGTVLGSGNGFLYSIAPQITTALTGTVSKVYDAALNATLNNSNYSSSGEIDGDTVVMNNPSVGTYDNKNVGTNKNIAVSGISIASATNGAATVYGYGNNTSANANIGRITPAALSVTGVSAYNKVADGNTNATLNFNAAILSGIYAGDTAFINPTNYAANFITSEAGSNIPISITFIGLNGADAGNYDVTPPGSVTGNILSSSDNTSNSPGNVQQQGSINATNSEAASESVQQTYINNTLATNVNELMTQTISDNQYEVQDTNSTQCVSLPPASF